MNSRPLAMAPPLIPSILRKLERIRELEGLYGARTLAVCEKAVQNLRCYLAAAMKKLDEAVDTQSNMGNLSTWLKQLRDITDEVDDLLDEWFTALVKSEFDGKNEEKLLRVPFLEKVRPLFFASASLCLGPIVVRNKIASKIKELNRRLVLIGITKREDNLSADSREGSDSGPRMFDQMTDYVADRCDVVGRGNDKRMIISQLLSDCSQQVKEPRVISIVGKGGMGKTTLAQQVFDDDAVKAHFRSRAWVCVTGSFDELKVAEAIIEQIEGVLPDTLELDLLLERIHGLIENKEFLLVLDNVSPEGYKKRGALERCLISGVKRSRILITTRDEVVARAMGSCYLHYLQRLSDKKGCSLFNRIAFFGKGVEQRNELEEIGRVLACKCEGLPLALRMLGCLMRQKHSKQEWQRIVEDRIWNLRKSECPCPPILLTYCDMPPALKHCFLLCSLFQKRERIHKANLIKLWMAQGYFSPEDHEIKQLGELYFRELVARFVFCNLEINKYSGEVISCKMHDMVHEFCQSLMGNEFSIIDARRDQLLRMGTIGSNNKKIRTLLVRNPSQLGNVTAALPCLFQRLTSLRILNLSDCEITEIPKEVGALVHLRYLDLSRNEQLKDIPETLCNLCNLQILRVNWCLDLQELPRKMGNLIELRHLENVGTYKLKSLPKGIGQLSSLQTLLQFPVSSGDDVEACKLEDLKDLNNLQDYLGITGLGNVADVSGVEKADMEKKVCLRKLHLDFSTSRRETGVINDEDVINTLKANTSLEEIVVTGYRGISMSPDWMMPLIGLRRLELKKCTRIKRLPPLGKLPFLLSLHIQGMCGVKKVDSEFLGIADRDNIDVNNPATAFPRLQSLEFGEMKRWEDWECIAGQGEEDISIMPSLRLLSFYHCPKLKALPHLLHRAHVKELNIRWCWVLEQRCKKGMGEDWHLISSIWNVSINNRFVQKHGLSVE